MNAVKSFPARPPLGRRRRMAVTYPLNEFYSARGLRMPMLEQIGPTQMPEPYHSLLVHHTDMTSRLEEFYRCDIHIRLVARHNYGADYFREVVLELDGSLKPVEFGAIKIVLDAFPSEAREAVLREQLPLGRILHKFEIKFTSRPQAFFQMAADSFIGGALQLAGQPQLYARRNTIFDAQKRPLAEIIEILPPL